MKIKAIGIAEFVKETSKLILRSRTHDTQSSLLKQRDNAYF